MSLNPKEWLSAILQKLLGGIVLRKVMEKGVKGATAVVVGFVTGPWVAAKVMPAATATLAFLQQLGVKVSIEFSPESFEKGLVVVLAGLFAAGVNWAKNKFELNIPFVA